MFTPAFWWVIVGIGLMLCEFVMPGLILFFFGLGALFTGLIAWLLPVGLPAQLLIFTIASVLSLFGLRRLIKPVFTGNATDVNADTFHEGMIGCEAEVTGEITPESAGKVMLNGTAWKAESQEVLTVGQRVVVSGQKSLTLIVKSV
ncbi:NfeD family protein [Pontiella agarivorans]|uniref:NfeD family protein n=1 Tax=Pontiella agarivorans TaxID=3038953 RepID=A0ABU5MZU5_9BACT|nr:NfeD family protein [Pontiella agarivorans]MDZ8119740.1 NfeD family protein [Pontiella agarivorans]